MVRRGFDSDTPASNYSPLHDFDTCDQTDHLTSMVRLVELRSDGIIPPLSARMTVRPHASGAASNNAPST
jgi:hypothetical protein